MGITDLLDHPFYYSKIASASASVAGQWHVGLAGNGYMLDLQLAEGLTRGTDAYQHGSVPLIRQQADASPRPGEASLNPDDLWRRSAETWEAGAGQNYYDRNFSTDGRYRASTGIDPSKRGQISLLPSTGVVLNSSNTNLKLAVASPYLYTLDGNNLRYTASLAFPSTWTTVTGTPGAAPTSIASDGHRIYITYPSDLYFSVRGSGSAAVYRSTPLANQTLVRYVKGRVLTAGGASVYDQGGGGTAPGALYTQPNSDWTWADITEGPNAIYLAGHSGDKSLIYFTAIKTDATALDAPVVAGELPDGEIVRSIQGYLGLLMIGTDKGVRFAVLSDAGPIATIGNLIPTDDPVVGFEPQDRFVWYTGATGGGDASTGRVDLEFLNGTTPAYWNDLNVVGGGHVPATSIVTYGDKRVFSTLQGIYAERSTRVPTGTITSGYIGYGLADNKTALRLATRHGPGAGSYQVFLTVDDGRLTPLGPPIGTSASGASGGNLSMNTRGELFEITLTLHRDTDDVTATPVVKRWTLRSAPAAQRRRRIVVPLLLHHEVLDVQDKPHAFDPQATVNALAALADSGQIVTYEEPGQSFAVIVMDYHWVVYKVDPKTGPSGTMAVSLGTI